MKESNRYRCRQACVRAAIAIALVAGFSQFASAEMVYLEGPVPEWSASIDSEVPSPAIGMANLTALDQFGAAASWRYVLGDQASRDTSHGTEQQLHPAPEPSSALIAAVGIAGLLRLRRRLAWRQSEV